MILLFYLYSFQRLKHQYYDDDDNNNNKRMMVMILIILNMMITIIIMIMMKIIVAASPRRNGNQEARVLWDIQDRKRVTWPAWKRRDVVKRPQFGLWWNEADACCTIPSTSKRMRAAVLWHFSQLFAASGRAETGENFSAYHTGLRLVGLRKVDNNRGNTLIYEWLCKQ